MSGRPFTIKAGSAQPVRIVSSGREHHTLINEGPSRVWIAEDAGVSPSYGIPLEAFTAIPWRRAGEAWAIADAAAAGDVALIVADGDVEWMPSPVAVAAQTAAQLLATGLPAAIAAQIQTSTLSADIAAKVAASSLPTSTAAQVAASSLSTDIASKVAGSSLSTDIASKVAASNLPAATASQITAGTLSADIASKTAAQLLSTGVSATFRSDLLFSGSIAAGGNAGLIDVTKYSEVVIQPVGSQGPFSGQAPLVLEWHDGNGNTVGQELISYAAADAFGNGLANLNRFAVVGGICYLRNTDATTPQQVRIIGTNRPAPIRQDTRQFSAAINVWTFGGNTASHTYTAGETATLQNTLGRPSQRLQGLCYGWFNFHATIDGQYFLRDFFGQSMILADSKEAFVSSAGQRYVSKLLALPAGGYDLNFTATAAGAVTAQARLIQAAL